MGKRINAAWDGLGRVDSWLGRLKLLVMILFALGGAALALITAFGLARFAFGLVGVGAIIFAGLLWWADHRPRPDGVGKVEDAAPKSGPTPVPEHLHPRLPKPGVVQREPRSKERPSGIEVVYPGGRRDATARPETVQIGADVQAPFQELPPGRPGDWMVSQLDRVTEANAMHRERANQVELALRQLDKVASLSLPGFIVCEVTHPTGLASQKSYRLELGHAFAFIRTPNKSWNPPSVMFSYPFESPDAPLADGPYEVEWFGTSTHPDSPRPPLANDRFTIRNGKVVT